jgi:nitrogen fixation protein FixH
MSDLTTSIEQKEKTAQFLWTGFILMFFVLQAILWTVAITLTAGDKSQAIVANYDERALNWESEVAQRGASARLGWRANLLVDFAADIRKFHVVTLTIQDSAATPVSGAVIELIAFHRALAGEPQQIKFVEVGDGVYSGNMQISKSGLWQFEGKAVRGSDVYLIKDQQMLK